MDSGGKGSRCINHSCSYECYYCTLPTISERDFQQLECLKLLTLFLSLTSLVDSFHRVAQKSPIQVCIRNVELYSMFFMRPTSFHDIHWRKSWRLSPVAPCPSSILQSSARTECYRSGGWSGDHTMHKSSQEDQVRQLDLTCSV